MNLNLPFLPNLQNSKNILIAGMGGGYDVFCGLPLFYELHNNGFQVHLANFSLHSFKDNPLGLQLNEHLFGLGATPDNIIEKWLKNNYQATYQSSFCEFYLVEFLQKKLNTTIPIWCFQKTGVQSLQKSYSQLVKKLSIDTIILVDGGVDSLIKGNEIEQGTLIEDTISLTAVNQLDVAQKYVVCLGMGTERDIDLYEVLGNINQLVIKNGYLGSCSLVAQMPAYQFYEEAVLYVQNHPYQDNKSVVNSSVISAVRGQYGNYHLTTKTEGSLLWINPLMSLLWCFELEKVANENLLLPLIAKTNEFGETISIYNQLQKELNLR